MNRKYVAKYRKKLKTDIDFFSKDNIEFMIDMIESLCDAVNKRDTIIGKQYKTIERLIK